MSVSDAGTLLRRIARIFVLLPLASVAIAAGAADAAGKNGFDLSGSLVPQNEILQGGPPRDGIPALDRPRFVSADDAAFLKPTDRILGIRLHDSVRAYPIRILNYHEIVNDMIGDQPVVITYCPLCGSGMAFHAKAGGQRLMFGVSGLLYNSDVLLFDRGSKSLWSQLRRQAVTGDMKGRMLEPLPVTHTTWRDWRARYPDSEVLSRKTGHNRDYDVDPYPGYGQDGRIYFPVSGEDTRYPRKAIVMGLEIDGRFKAYPLVEMNGGPSRFRDELRGTTVEIVFDEKNQTAKAYRPSGEQIPTVLAFWFAWYAFHPETEVYRPAGRDRH